MKRLMRLHPSISKSIRLPRKGRSTGPLTSSSANAESDKPFFLYYASHFVSMMTSHPDWAGKSAQGTHSGDQFMEHDDYVGQILRTLEDLGIAENTLVVWMSDNGPMYDFFPESSSSAYTGGKGDVLEGGVHVPAIAWWSGVIEPNRLSGELLHVTDMYTTAARIGGKILAYWHCSKSSSHLLCSTPTARRCKFRRAIHQIPGCAAKSLHLRLGATFRTSQ